MPRICRLLLGACTYLLFLLLVVSFGLEILLSLFLPAPGLAYSQKFKQDIPGLKSEFVYDRNAWGLRSLGMKTLAKPPHTLRVIVLGASTTDQATQNTEDTWSGILETKLTQHFASKNLHIEVAAYGRGGDTIYDTLCFTRDSLVDLNPDLVIVLQGVNDMAWNGGPDYRFDPKSPLNCPGFMTHFLRQHSEVFRWAIHLKNQWRVKKALATGGAIEWHSQNLPEIRKKFAALPMMGTLERNPDPIVEFSQGLRQLGSLLDLRQIPALFLSQPTLWQADMQAADLALLWFSIQTNGGPRRLDPAWLALEMQRYNAVTASMATYAPGGDLYYFDLAQSIPKSSTFFFDDCHFTDVGSEKVAAAIFPVTAAILAEHDSREH